MSRFGALGTSPGDATELFRLQGADSGALALLSPCGDSRLSASMPSSTVVGPDHTDPCLALPLAQKLGFSGLTVRVLQECGASLGGWLLMGLPLIPARKGPSLPEAYPPKGLGNQEGT